MKAEIPRLIAIVAIVFTVAFCFTSRRLDEPSILGRNKADTAEVESLKASLLFQAQVCEVQYQIAQDNKKMAMNCLNLIELQMKRIDELSAARDEAEKTIKARDAEISNLRTRNAIFPIGEVRSVPCDMPPFMIPIDQPIRWPFVDITKRIDVTNR